MRRPSRRRRQGGWPGSALAAVALLVFVGIGAWEYQHLQEQEAQDELRTSRLIACLEAAQRARDTTAATKACAVKYADRVPALLAVDPYALAPRPTTASGWSPLGAMSPSDPSAPRPTLSPSPSHAGETAGDPDPTRSGAAPVERPEGRDPAAEQRVSPPVDLVSPGRSRDAKAPDASARPRATPGGGVEAERPAATEPARPAPRPSGSGVEPLPRRT